MRSLILGLAGGLGLALAVQAQDGAGITATIQKQFDAFIAGDVATAFTFASPGIKQFFGTSERFGQMVQQGYPMVWRPSGVKYLEQREIGGMLWQKVLVTDMNGVPHLLDYQMVETENGWQINGVRILEAPEVGA